MASYRMTALPFFQTANAAYANAEVTIYEVDPVTGIPNGQLADLFTDIGGQNPAKNPQTLTSAGCFSKPIYANTALVCVVGDAAVPDSVTGIFFPTSGNFQGAWLPNTLYQPGDIVTDGAAGLNTSNIYISTSVQTSSGSWAADLTAGKWSLALNITGLALAAAQAVQQGLGLPVASPTVTGAVRIGGTGIGVDGSGNISVLYGNTSTTAAQGNAVLFKANNLSDLTSVVSARASLGLGSMATQNASSVAITGGSITGLGNPTSGSDAVNKTYVDTLGLGLTPKGACSIVTTTNLPCTYNNGTAGVGATITITATGVFTYDTVTPNVGDSVLFAGQTSGFQNGIYTMTTAGSVGVSAVFTRRSDFNSTANILAGSWILIDNGAAYPTGNKGTQWYLTTQGPYVVGTTNLVFTNLGAAYLAVNNNLSDLGSVSTALTNLGLLSTAQTVFQAVLSASIF